VAAAPIPDTAGQGDRDKELHMEGHGTPAPSQGRPTCRKVPKPLARGFCLASGEVLEHTDSLFSRKASTQLNFNINKD